MDSIEKSRGGKLAEAAQQKAIRRLKRTFDFNIHTATQIVNLVAGALGIHFDENGHIKPPGVLYSGPWQAVVDQAKATND